MLGQLMHRSRPSAFVTAAVRAANGDARSAGFNLMASFKDFRQRAKDGRNAGPPSGSGSNSHYRSGRSNSGNGDGQPSHATEMSPRHLESLRQIESEGEPISLAEEVAELTERGDLEKAAEALELLNKQGETHIAELQRMSMPQLLEEAQKEGLEELTGLKRQDLIFRILKEKVKLNGHFKNLSGFKFE